MATIHPHPAILHSPIKIDAFQRRYGLLIVLGATGPQAIPAIHLRPQAATRAPHQGDAA